jgi:hypothetical protein
MATIPAVIYNNSGTTQQSLLLASQQQMQFANQSTLIGNLVQSTIANSTMLNSQLQSQLAQTTIDRYQPYQPYIYPMMPSSVIQLEMATANVGNPMPPFMRCRGSQFVTT